MHTTADKTGDKFLWPAFATIILLIFYYAQYVIALSMGCFTFAFGSKMPKARKVGFFTGIVVHFFFIFSVMFGVFNRHFRNGGVQLLAYTVMNLYIYLLVVLNWPVRTYKREFEVADEKAGAADSDAAPAASAPPADKLNASPDVKRFRGN